MRFKISRASSLFDKEQPFEGAMRDGDDWYIEVGSLDALQSLIAKVGTVVVGRTDIMIYDDYIE